MQRLLASLLLLLGTACGYARGEVPPTLACEGMGCAPNGRACCLPALPRASIAPTTERADYHAAPARAGASAERTRIRCDRLAAAGASRRESAPAPRTHRVQHRGEDEDAA